MTIFDDDEKKKPAPASAPSREKKTIEQWGEAKGLLPELITVPARIGVREVRAPRQNPKFVQFTMAKAHRKWPEGAEVTEAEFDAAVAEAGAVGIS